MVTGQCRYLQQRDPRKVRIVYEKPRWHDVWDNNPRIARPGEKGDFQEFRPRAGYKRAYIADKTPNKWTWRRWGPEWGGSCPRGELYLTAEELAFGERYAGRVVIEPHLKKNASQMKAWGWERWMALADCLRARGINATQIGPPGVRSLPGIEFIETGSARLAASVIARARGAALPEGALHHIAAAVGTPAVVIFGGYISPAVTGYPEQVSLFTGGDKHPLGCGMRVPCRHCADAMSKIGPFEVAEELMKLVEERAAA